MTPQPRSPVHRPTLKWRQPALAACLALNLIFSGCIGLQLSQFQKHAARGDHAWIAAQAIVCPKRSDACGRLHLIKGDACFRLAKAGREPIANYTCAANELNEGLTLTSSWDAAGEQLPFQENLCESLKNLQERQSGETAAQTMDRLTEAAKALYQLAPGSVPAVYYLSTARLRQIEPMLMDINAATRLPVCNRLKRTVTRVLSVIETANSQTIPGWDRFADNYQRLAFELGVTLRAAGCR